MLEDKALKGGKIHKPGKWKTKENILVFQLYGLGLSELNPYLELYRESIIEALSALTIDEVWITDFVGEDGDSTLSFEDCEVINGKFVSSFDKLWMEGILPIRGSVGAYDAVNVFALYPEENWGLYENPNTKRKPFG